jgi:hypothetical protein
MDLQYREVNGNQVKRNSTSAQKGDGKGTNNWVEGNPTCREETKGELRIRSGGTRTVHKEETEGD